VGFMGTGNCTSARSSVQRVVQGRSPHVSPPFGEVVAAGFADRADPRGRELGCDR